MSAEPLVYEDWGPEGWAHDDWRAFARCRDSDPNLFFPVGRGQVALEQAEEAKLVCRECPSREPCLAFALSAHEELGVWGGTSPQERREFFRGRRGAIAS